MRKVCIITGTRAEYGQIVELCKALFPPLADYSSSLSVACPADRGKVMKIKNKISCKTCRGEASGEALSCLSR